jgi:hypothetical protein
MVQAWYMYGTEVVQICPGDGASWTRPRRRSQPGFLPGDHFGPLLVTGSRGEPLFRGAEHPTATARARGRHCAFSENNRQLHNFPQIEALSAAGSTTNVRIQPSWILRARLRNAPRSSGRCRLPAFDALTAGIKTLRCARSHDSFLRAVPSERDGSASRISYRRDNAPLRARK